MGLAPPGITIGTTAEWTVNGQNLAEVKRFLISGEGVTIVDRKPKSDSALALTIRARPGAAPGLREFLAESPGGLSNVLLFRVDTIPQVMEREPNDDPARATEFPVDSAVVGSLRPGDLDYFRFTGQAGQRVTVEIEAHRLGSPILPVVTLLSASGSALAEARSASTVMAD